MAVLDAEDFELSTTSGFQTRLDNDYVKALLVELELKGAITEAEHRACYKDIVMNTIRTNRKDKTKKPVFVPPNLANATATGVVDMLGKVREQSKDLEKEEGIYKEWLQLNYLKPIEDAAKAAAKLEGGVKGVDDLPDWAKK